MAVYDECLGKQLTPAPSVLNSDHERYNQSEMAVLGMSRESLYVFLFRHAGASDAVAQPLCDESRCNV